MVKTLINPNPKSHSFLLLIFFSQTTMTVSEAPSSPCNSSDSGPIKSSTPLISFLQRLQQTALTTFGDSGFDPKRYVDMSLKFSLLKTEEAFNHLDKSNNGVVSVKDLEGFFKMYLNEAGSDLIYHEPEDFVAEPVGFLPNVLNSVVRDWALEVHGLWKNLSRRVDERVIEQPELHTLLPLPLPVIVPGERFREVYYWDSYWVIRGLLVSKMYETSKSIVHNLVSLIDKYGYVLNGARAYYSNRSCYIVEYATNSALGPFEQFSDDIIALVGYSNWVNLNGRDFWVGCPLCHVSNYSFAAATLNTVQPPLLSAMILEIYNRTGDLSLVKRSLPALLKEYSFWNSGIHKVTIQDSEACNHTLSRYYAMWNKPRPESSTMDKESASSLSKVSEKQKFYRELASTAESGWDFSTRWMRNHSDITTLATTSILPVDLNAYILKMELDIAFLARATGDESTEKRFLEASQSRRKAMNSIFWNAKSGQWLDYWLSNSSICEEVHKWEAHSQNQNTFASNFIPIWIELFYSDDATVEKITKNLQSSGLVCAAGIATSLSKSREQWDFPNGWAPLQHMIVEGLARSGSKEARSVAEEIAVRWIRTNYAAYKKTGSMHEKYDVEACGKAGGGGEYKPQTGFGWSNGVVLAFLEEFGWPLDRKIDC